MRIKSFQDWRKKYKMLLIGALLLVVVLTTIFFEPWSISVINVDLLENNVDFGVFILNFVLLFIFLIVIPIVLILSITRLKNTKKEEGVQHEIPGTL